SPAAYPTRIDTTVKPFAGTLRVTNPARKSRTSSRKRVLRGGWVTTPTKRRQPDQTLCDRAPKSQLVVSPRRCRSRGPRQATNSWSTQPAWSHRGRRSMANDHKGSSGNLGDPVVSIEQGGRRYRLTNSRSIHGSASGAGGGRTTDATMVSPSEGNEARRNGRQGVAAPHSTVEAGEPTRGTPSRGRGCRLMSR